MVTMIQHSQQRAKNRLRFLPLRMISEVLSEKPRAKLLMVGSCDDVLCLAQLNADGSLDHTYGTTQLGYFRLDQAGLDAIYSSTDLLILPDGRAAVLACDGGGHYYAIFIVKSDGSNLDHSLVNGQGYNSFPAAVCARQFKRQSNGMFDVALAYKVPGYGYTMGVQRVLSDISGLDSSFGNNGTAFVAFGLDGSTGDDEPSALVIQSNDKIVVGGAASKGTATVLGIARLLSNGQLDDTFGDGDGRLHYPGNSAETQANDLALDSKERVVFGGYIDEAGTHKRLMGRLTSAGQFDATFGTTGLAEYSFPNSGDASVASVVVDAQTIVIGSNVPGDNLNNNFSVSRIDLSGRLVSTFATNGTLYGTYMSSSTRDTASNAIITRHGIVVAGYSSLNDVVHFGIARVQFDYIFSDSFE